MGGSRLSPSRVADRERERAWMYRRSGDLHSLNGLPGASAEFLRALDSLRRGIAIITGLVERGLIVRVAHPNARRSLFLQLTTAGHDVMETTYRSFQTAITVSAETLDAAQTAVLESALSDLARSLSRYGTAARSIAAE